jgi:hypothetical protein
MKFEASFLSIDASKLPHQHRIHCELSDDVSDLAEERFLNSIDKS